MQKVNFNIISRDDWAQLANKQFGYFYFVVDDVTVLDAGGDLYLGENLIGSGLTIEEIVQHFENPENEYTFPGITVGDLVPRGETTIEVTDRLGIHAMAEKRYFSGEEGKLKKISGVSFDDDNPSTTLKCGLNTGSFQNWNGSYVETIIAVKSNMFISNAIESGGNYYFVFPCVKGVASRYGNPDIGTNNGYVVVGGEETFVGYYSSLDVSSFDISNYTEMTGTRLDGQPQSDTHTYYMPSDVGSMCVGYATAPVMTQNQDGSYTVTVNGVEVGCHLAMDNKKDDVSGESCAIGYNFGNNMGGILGGILPSESGPGACDEIVISGNGATFIRRIEMVSANNISWDYDGGTYDEENDYYIWRIYGSIDGMKPDGAFAITGGYENAYIDSYTDGNTICIMAPGDDSSPYDLPSEIDCEICYELDEPNTETIQGFSEDIPVSKYGVMFNIDDSIVGDEYGVYTTVEYQQSGGDQIWNAIAYQREMAEVTAAALCDLDSRIGEVDFSSIQSQIDELEDNLEEVSEVTATALNYLNGEVEDINADISVINSDITEIQGDIEDLSDEISEIANVTATALNELDDRVDNLSTSIDNIVDFLNDDIPVWDEEIDKTLTLTAKTAGSTVSLVKNGTPTATVQYSTDNGETWSNYTFGDVITLANVGDTVKFKGENSAFSSSSQKYYQFQMTGRISASGDITSLLNGSGGDFTLYTKSYCFYRLFCNCTSLVKAPNLPSTTLGTYCYNEMFSGCTSLIATPDLPAMTLTQSCYQYMFYGCYSLTITPELPAKTLANGCYESMFYGCTALTTAPALPATTLQQFCYEYMFKNCTSLVNAPALPATTLEMYCYSYMFDGCTSLVNAPSLPATTLTTYCYRYMFQNCTSLVTAPVLPATTLQQYCYQGMFNGCTSLTTAPELPATTLVNYCYRYMFQNCSNLNYIKALFTTTPSDTYTKDWVSGVSATGTFVKNSSAAWNMTGTNGVPSGWVVSTNSQNDNLLTFIANTAGSTVKLSKSGTPTATVQYSTDGGTNWNDYEFETVITLSNVDDSVKFKGNNITLSTVDILNNAQYYSFVMTGGISAFGDVTSLLNGVGGDVDLTGAKYCFYSLFKNCTALTTAPNLPSTKLDECCYQEMFYGCTALTTAPTLPATTLANRCYHSIFYGCTGLTQSPELPATTLAPYCYNSMFRGCTALVTAPLLQSMILSNNCYESMFYGCTALTTAPELPASILEISCYCDMFYGCTALTTAPVLAASVVPNNGYREMFYGCTHLNYVECVAETLEGDWPTDSWMTNVAATGTFVKSQNATWESGANGIPSGWTVQEV